MKNAWIRVHVARPLAIRRLVCFPHAGGGGNAYRPWANTLPEDVELCAIELPGRETRFGEPLVNRMPTLLEALEPIAEALCDRDTVFFGHSMGAVLAYELALRLEARGGRVPRHLVVSARRAPHLAVGDPAIHALSDDAFLDALVTRYEGIPAELLAHRDLIDLLLPIVRADITLLETFTPTRDGRLGCPISAFGGVADRHATREQLEGWAAHTAGGFDCRTFEGGHFYLGQRRDQVMDALSAILRRGGTPRAVAARA